jgi:hypothetical protein
MSTALCTSRIYTWVRNVAKKQREILTPRAFLQLFLEMHDFRVRIRRHALPDYALLYYYRHYQLRPSRYPYLQQIAVLRQWNFGLCENPEFLVYALAQIRSAFLEV